MRSNTNTRARSRGFTIMEVMFTVSIAAVLMAVAVPSFRSLMANNRLASQATELVAAVNFARSEAISRNTTVTLCRANLESSTNCAASVGEWDFFIVRNAAGTVLRRGALPDYGTSMYFESDLTLDRIAFSPDGLARTGGTLVSDREFVVCSSAVSGQNMRIITVGAGSRLSTTKDEGECT